MTKPKNPAAVALGKLGGRRPGQATEAQREASRRNGAKSKGAPKKPRPLG